jgi:hypothetical protein
MVHASVSVSDAVVVPAHIAVLLCVPRLLLQLLLRPSVGPVTKRHTAEILQALAATKLGEHDEHQHQQQQQWG